MNAKIIFTVVGLMLFSAESFAHHNRVVQVKVVAPVKVVPAKVVVTPAPKVVVVKNTNKVCTTTYRRGAVRASVKRRCHH